MKNKSKKIIKNCLEYLILFFTSFISIAPLFSCILVAFKRNSEMSNPTSFPESIYFGNFKIALNEGNLLLAFLITMIIIFLVVTISTMLSAGIAYALSRLKFKFKKQIIGLFIFAMFIPTIGIQVSVFKMMATLELVNTILGYVLLLCNTDIFAILIFMRYFESFSSSLDDVAIINGYSPIRIFFKVYVPLLKPAFLTIAIIKGINIFNEFYLANLYLQDKTNLPTITTALYSFIGPFGAQYNIICAGIILSLIPILIIFSIFQKNIYNGFTGSQVIITKKRRKDVTK